MQLVGVNAVGHRHARNRCTRLPAGFNCALLEFETVGPSGRHIVSAKISVKEPVVVAIEHLTGEGHKDAEEEIKRWRD